MNLKFKVLILLAMILAALNGIFLYQKYQSTLSEEGVKNNKNIQALIENMSKTVELNTKQFVSLGTFSQEPSSNSAKIFENLFNKIRSERIFRIKVWDTNYRVIWSNLPELVNKRFPDNQEIKEALEGKVENEFKINQKGGSDRTELRTESLYNNFVETYVPIKDATGRVAGIVEVYQAIESEIDQIRSEFNKLIIASIGVSLGILVLAFFGLKLVNR